MGEDPFKSCLMQVTGATVDGMMEHAKMRAASFLREDIDDLVAEAAGMPEVAEYQRFVRHAGEEKRPLRWQMSVVVRLHPDIVKARREAANGGLEEYNSDDDDD